MRLIVPALGLTLCSPLIAHGGLLLEADAVSSSATSWSTVGAQAFPPKTYTKSATAPGGYAGGGSSSNPATGAFQYFNLNVPYLIDDVYGSPPILSDHVGVTSNVGVATGTDVLQDVTHVAIASTIATVVLTEPAMLTLDGTATFDSSAAGGLAGSWASVSLRHLFAAPSLLFEFEDDGFGAPDSFGWTGMVEAGTYELTVYTSVLVGAGVDTSASSELGIAASLDFTAVPAPAPGGATLVCGALLATRRRRH